MGHTQLFLFGLLAAAAAAFWYDARVEVNRAGPAPSAQEAAGDVDRPNMASMR